MPFPWMAAALAASAGASVWGAHSANRANKNAAREQMAFQERMSSTAHQRQMQDMRAAGLNPALSAKYGGASSPGGASFTAQNEADSLPAAVSSAMQYKRLRAELDNMGQQNLLIQKQAELAAATAKNYEAQTEVLNATKPISKVVSGLGDKGHQLVEDMNTGNYPKGSVRDWAKGVGRNIYNALHWPSFPSWMNEAHNRNLDKK